MAVKPVLYPMRGWSARRFRANWLCSRSFQRCPRAEPWPSVASSCKGCVHVRFRYIALKLKARWGSAWVIQNPSYCGGPVRLVSLLQGLNGLRRFINVSELRQRVAVQATLFQKTTVPCMDWDVLSEMNVPRRSKALAPVLDEIAHEFEGQLDAGGEVVQTVVLTIKDGDAELAYHELREVAAKLTASQ